MALKLSNNATGFLAAALAPDGLTIGLQPGQGSAFPALSAGDWFPGTLIGTNGAIEVVRATVHAGDSFTITRAQENTTAQAFNPGDRFEHRLTAGAVQAIVDAAVRGEPRVGDLKMWHGAIADIATVHGPGWQLADGTNGTADLRNRFVVGAGDQYAPGDNGGAASVTLTSDQMPAHGHAITDPGHVHGVTDPTHAHSVYDPGHAHSMPGVTCIYDGHTGFFDLGGSGNGGANGGNGTYSAGTGIGIYGAATGISIQSHVTGITIANAGSGNAHENRPPYYALAYIEYTGSGVTDTLTT